MILRNTWEIIVLAAFDGEELAAVRDFLVHPDTVLIWYDLVLVPMNEEYWAVDTANELIGRNLISDDPLHRK